METYKMNKYQFGGKNRRPFTGFEGLTYEYEAPDHSLQGRAQRPEIETIYNNGKFLSSKETWYDPEIYNNTGKLQIEDQGYSIGDGAETEWEPNEQQKRIFNSLKRHALMNQRFKKQEPSIFQQGGQLNMNEQELQQAFIQFLAQKTGAKNQQELESAIQQLGEEGLKQAYAEFMNLLQQQQVQAAKFGAKLNYIKSLRGQCPEGYELSYYKVGGTLCKKCMKKQQAMEDGGQIPQNPIDQFKCGRKMKKKTNKKENGGELNSTKNPQVFSKMTLAKCGTKLKEACKKIDVNKCGKKLKKKCEQGGPIKNKRTLPSDRATRDSIAVNKYNDQTIQTTRPGTYKKNSQGQIQWTPDRSKYPYRKLPNKK